MWKMSSAQALGIRGVSKRGHDPSSISSPSPLAERGIKGVRSGTNEYIWSDPNKTT
jgi:hypothetical protein